MNGSTSLKDTFQNIVDVYDKARPRYPQTLLNDILCFSDVSSFQTGLEVGAGTGQATEMFIDKIEQLDVVEVGEKQVEFLNHKFKDRNVFAYKSYFEDFDTVKKYDLIYSATAFHWVDANIGYPKAWSMLNNGGTMAVFWHMFSVTFHDEGLFKGLNRIDKKYMPDHSLGFDDKGIEEVKKRRISQIQSGNFFSVSNIKEYRWNDKYDADRYSLLLESFSSTQKLPENKKLQYLHEVKQYINENGGNVVVPQHVMLYLMKK